MLRANHLKLLVQRIKMIVNITYCLSCLYLSFSSHISNDTYQTCNCIRRHVLQLKCTCVHSAPPLFRLGPSQDKLPLRISVPLFSCQGISYLKTINGMVATPVKISLLTPLFENAAFGKLITHHFSPGSEWRYYES